MTAKTFKVITLCALFLCASVATMYAQDDATKKMLGKWTYKMDIPSVGEIDGDMTFIADNGEVKFTTATPNDNLTSSPLKLVDGKYACKVDSEYGELRYSFHWKAGGADVLIMQMSMDMLPDVDPVEMTRAK